MTATLLMLWLALLAAKGTPAGRLLNRLMVEKRAAWLSRVRRGSVIAFGLLGTALIVAGMMGHDAPVIAALSMPELTAVLASAEMTIWIDAAIAVGGAASLLHAKGAGQWLRARIGVARQRAARTRRPRRPAEPSNDDDPAWALAA